MEIQIQDIEEMPGGGSRTGKYKVVYDKLHRMKIGDKFRAGPFEDRRIADSLQSTIGRWVKSQSFLVTTSVRDEDGEIIRDGKAAWVYFKKLPKEQS